MKLPLMIRRPGLTAGVALAAVALAGCGGAASGTAAGGQPPAAAGAGAAAGAVLPTSTNPIHNTATASTLKVDKVLVENNVDAAGRPTNDHLEVHLSNTGSTPLRGLEFFYTFTDTKTNQSESYYAKLPADQSVPAGGSRTVNFDNSGNPGSVPVNKYSLYATSKDALKVTVMISAQGAAPVTTIVDKAAGGAETGD